ncbi:MAG: DUF92 domain-containing protein [Chlorobiales bacterium]|nr:DUF92 domain-containing protein [Chlorobiales bacterium]
MNIGLPLSQDFTHFVIAFFALLALIVISELSRKALGIKSVTTRKIVHILTAVLTFFAPYYFETNFYPALLAAVFIPLNLLAIKMGWFKSLNEDGDPSLGTIYYPLAFLILTLFFWGDKSWILQISMLVLGFGDAFAALVGENAVNPHHYKLAQTTKSIEGSIAMFGTSLIVLVGSLVVFHDRAKVVANMDLITLIALCVAIALVATAVEALLSGGLDNLAIPLTVAYVFAVLENNGTVFVQSVLIGVSLSLLLARVSFALKFLTASGAIGTFLFGSNVFSMGGLAWTVPVLTFFVLSSVLSKIGRERKKKFDLIFEKSSQRDAGQVVANGGVAWILMIWYSITNDPIIFIAYLGTLAAAQADTWATEIGTMIRNPRPRSILNFKPVPAGTSGGITVTGTTGGFVGALLICVSAWAIVPDQMLSIGVVQSFLIVGLAGLGGSLIDSFFGATLQAMYYDPFRKKVTERTHSMSPEGKLVANELQKGIRWVDNDVVNFLCTMAGAAVAIILTNMIAV